MSDAADFAAELHAAEIAAGLARIDAAIPVGVAGECEGCFEIMPRLVGGRCAYCRDGRTPPPGRFDVVAVTPPAPPSVSPITAVSQPKEPEAMPTQPNTAERHTVKIIATGDILAAIRERADRDSLYLTEAAISLIDEGLKAMAALRVEPGPELAPAPTMVLLANVPDAWLAEEVMRRLTTGVGSDDYDAAIARADKAEAKFDRLRAALAEVG